MATADLKTGKKRLWYPGACYHVMSRGIRRSLIFEDPEDYKLFLMILRATQKKMPFTLHSYCLMSNHVHLQISTNNDEIGKVMHRVLSNYARAFNKKHSYSGHLFESRYTSCLITDEKYFLEVSRYIHLNPVKAKIVKNPLDYQYSSYQNYVYRPEKVIEAGNALENALVDTSKVLGCFQHEWIGENTGKEAKSAHLDRSNRHGNQEAYRRFVERKSPNKKIDVPYSIGYIIKENT